jgi:hypothetical protein
MQRSPQVRVFLPALYALAAFIAIAPIVDVIGAAWPLRPADAAWRFGTLGLEFRSILLQVAGVGLAMTVAAVMSHRAVLRVLSIGAFVFALALGAGIARFIADYRLTIALVDAAAGVDFGPSAFRAMLAATLAVPVLTVLGGRAWMASGAQPAAAEPENFGLGRTTGSPSLRKHVIPFPRRHSVMDPDRRQGF